MVSRLQSRLGQIQEGLLIGKGTGSATEVCDFRSLSKEQAAKLRAGQGAPGSERDSSVVGYFRVLQDGELRMSAEDLALAKSAFPKPHQVVLLIQQSVTGVPHATFFFWDAGRMFGDFAFLEFAFDASSLASMATPAREHVQTAPEDLSVTEAAEGNTPEAKASGSVIAANTPKSEAVLKIQQGASRQIPDENAPKASPLRIPSRKIALAAMLLVICAGLVAGLLKVRAGRRPTTAASPSSAALQTDLLGLRVERQRGDLLMKWNRAAPAIASATVGTLIVEDGETPRVIPLQKNLLQGGSLLYSPASDTIKIRLTVEAPGQQPATEMILVILPAGGPPEVQALKRAPAVERSTQRSTAPPDDRNVSAEREAAPLQQQVRPFAGLPTPPATATPIPADSPVVPAPSAAGGQDTIEQLQKVLRTAPILSPSAPVQSAAPPKAVEFRGPEILSRTVPSVPPAFRGPSYQSETVKLTISLDENGKITKIISQASLRFPLLVPSAEAAARKWTFKPAMMGDRPVASEIVLNFKFDPLR